MNRIATVLLLCTFAACASSNSSPPVATSPKSGAISASVRALTSVGQITRVSITITPAGITQELIYDAGSGNFVGTIVVPAGTQTVTATAYVGTAVVGVGTASNVNVAANVTTGVTIRILDTTGAPPAPDHGPFIISLVVSNTTPVTNEQVSIAATVVDPDGDLITYGWSDDCSGAFANMAVASTSWSAASAGVCHLTVTATAKALHDTASVSVTVFNPTQLQVSATFVPQPVITGISLMAGSNSCVVNRNDADASCHMPITTGQTVVVTFAASGGDITTYQLTSSCGGTITGSAGVYAWTAPILAGLCELTASAGQDTLADSFAVAVLAEATKVVGWGSNADGETDVPAGLTGAGAIAAGNYHSLALRNDGTVSAWGRNTDGQIEVPANLIGVTSVAAGSYHSLAVKSDGTVAAWGSNTYGQTAVPEGLSGIVAVAGGDVFSLALKSDGTVVGWGPIACGGVAVPGGLIGVVAIAAGWEHCLALLGNGTVVGWGRNDLGQVNAPAGLNGVVAISARGEFSLALKGDGTVVGWGDNSLGQVNVPAGLAGVAAIAAGGYHSLALKSDGTVVSWGQQVDVPLNLARVIAIAAGRYHSLALSLSP